MALEQNSNPNISREMILPASTDVVIVGGGLSGLFLLKDLGNSVNVVLIDKRKDHQHKEAMYLTSQNVAKKWGMGNDFHQRARTRQLISGITTFNTDGNVRDKVEPGENNEYGFLPMAQTVMEAHLKKRINSSKIYKGVECQSVSEHKDQVSVVTNKGIIKANIVIDATGWQGNLIHEHYGDEADSLFAMYGGNFTTKGFDPRLLYFLRVIPNNNRNWVMPIGPHGSEVIAAKETRRSNMNQWWSNEAERAFEEMVEWYRNHDFQINHQDKKAIPMAFRVEPAGSKYFKGHIVPFGEAAGQNSPLWGQLIDVLPHYSQTLSKIIIEAKSRNEWGNVSLVQYSI